MASATYVVIEPQVAGGADTLLDAVRKDARQRRPDETDSLKTRQRRWNTRELAAYVVEYGLGYGPNAFTGSRSPTDDPEQFYREYIRGESLKAARATLTRWPRAYPQVWRALHRLAPADLVERARDAVLIASQEREPKRQIGPFSSPLPVPSLAAPSGRDSDDRVTAPVGL